MAEPQTDRERQELAMLLRDIKQRKRQQIGGTLGRMLSHAAATAGGDHARSRAYWYPDREKKALAEEDRKLALLKELDAIGRDRRVEREKLNLASRQSLEQDSDSYWDRYFQIMELYADIQGPLANRGCRKSQG